MSSLLRHTLCAALCLTFLFASALSTNAWKMQVWDHPNGPSEFLLVDKKSQELFFYEQHSPLSLKEHFVCTTGQTEGDKFREGDLRTPEGVYFLESKLTGGLDFDLYGDMAYVLNFPNPVDRIKGKTGSGIWIHGRGHPVTPRETKGCVAVYDPDLDRLDKNLYMGMPLVIAQEVVSQQQEIEVSDEDMNRLVNRVNAWAASWSNRSEDFFDFYDPVSFTKSKSDIFEDFAAHKRELFGRLEWIDVMTQDIRIIPGPDYWVTYFGQFYRSPFLISEGLKRLYWQKDENGEFRIVGREWERRPLNLKDEYLAKRQEEIKPELEGWRLAWEQADLESYLAWYAEDAKQGNREGLDIISEQKRSLWQDAEPLSVNLKNVSFDLHPQGMQVTFVQVYKSKDGYSDEGYKTLVLRPVEDGWLIVNEDWRAM